MLTIEVPETEFYDEDKNEFFTVKKQSLKLEHSLVSISKWESKWKKPFLNGGEKTDAEIIDYVRCMTIGAVDDNVYAALSSENKQQIADYIGDSMTATTFSNVQKNAHKKEIVTSELIYYWMVAYQIPSEYERWHLNRLITLITICSIKNAPPKKMSKSEVMRRNTALNAARRQQLHSKG